ncbi:MAG: hypothetical protein RLZZ534_595 [Actinomycetota bacterium]
MISTRGNVPAIVYWGSNLGKSQLSETMFARPVLAGGLDFDAPLAIIPQHRDGWLGVPGLEIFRGDSNTIFPHLQITSTEIHDTSATFILSDKHVGLEAVLQLQIDASEVLKVSATLRNLAKTAYNLQALRVALPIASRANELLTFGGRWAMEFGEHRTPWHDSTISITNLRGRTSHEKWPLIFAGTSGFSEQQGEVWGCHLGWSGNFEITADGVTEHHKHLLVSERLVAGEIILQPGDSYTAPTIYAVHSTNGLSGASQHFHQYVRSLPQHLETERPVIINTWEAVYFDHDLKTLTALADVAASIGVERFVLDDGWFTGRRNDSAGLGDWSVDATVWPQGLTPLIEHVRSRNMQFGIWFEPEMVSVNSDLYRKHPDWALHDANYGQITGRNQLVLDMSRADVRDYLYAHISKLLDEHDIAYIKWDHNRDLVATGAHAQTLGTYELLDRLKRKHPLVQFESCASGGGRIDFGILPHVSRFWTSDSIDALDRTLIQRGATRLMPHEILGSHIGSRVNHITRRSHSLAFRASTAIFGWLGIESNLLTAPPEEIARLTEVIAKYKSLRPLIHTGSSFNEDHPDTNIVVHGVSNSDGLSTIVSITRLNNGQSNHIDPIRIHDLEPQAEYRISPIYFGTPAFSPHRQLPQWMEDASFSMSGLQLQQIGFICPPLLPASSFIVMLERVMS